jgi:hypothetical protein
VDTHGKTKVIQLTVETAMDAAAGAIKRILLFLPLDFLVVEKTPMRPILTTTNQNYAPTCCVYICYISLKEL